MSKKMFAIVGLTSWGKSNTLYQLFDRGNFQPLYSPIKPSWFDKQGFTVINASNEDKWTENYLKRLKDVLKKHKKSDTVFVITVSLYFHGVHDIKPVFNFLNSLGDFDITYIVLKHGWRIGNTLSQEDISEMKSYISENKIKPFDTEINESEEEFEKRTELISKFIRGKLKSSNLV